MNDWARVHHATSHLQPPLAAVDVPAVRANAADLAKRAAGTPIRVATKSVRCRAVLDLALATPGFAGLMAYSLPEALWLASLGASDVLVAYPSVDLHALYRLAADPELAAAVTVMVDDPAHLDLVDRARTRAGPRAAPVRVCLDVDASLRVGPLHLGVRRSPVHTPAQARTAAEHITRRPGVRLVGLMVYDAQVAGVQDVTVVHRAVKAASSRELRRRRAAVVQAVSQVAELEIVNGGGTGSVHLVGADPSVTEVAAGSGLFGAGLFDRYRAFRPQPALAYALPVTRRPAPGIRTLFGGGYVASGPAGPDRLPAPWWPAGLRLLAAEGVGEVQTPVRGQAADRLAVGDRVWWRHAKAGEVCERFAELHLVDRGADGHTTVTAAPTYRGEGRCFG